MKIVGYVNRLSVAPGENLEVMVSTRAEVFEASMVRLAGAGGPANIPGCPTGPHLGLEQEVRLGSYIVVSSEPLLKSGAAFTLEAWIWQANSSIGRTQAIAGCFDGKRGFAAGIDEGGAAALWLGDGRTVTVVSTRTPLQPRAWFHISASYDAVACLARVVQVPDKEWPTVAERTEGAAETQPWLQAEAPFMLAASGNPATAHFNGKLEAPRLLDGAGAAIASWNLGGVYGGELIEDASDHGRHGRCVNSPMRAVTGRRWRGAATDPARAPADYAAIWFHDDDLDDAQWEPSLELTISGDLPSGVYAIRLAAGESVDEVPFFVKPCERAARRDVAVLMPTLSYMAYGNEHNSWANPIPATPGLSEILEAVGERDRYAAKIGLKSIYELHSDGSGVAYASRRRPIVNMRADYGMPLLRGGPHQFSADLQLLKWLDRQGTTYDVITDEDLHHEGASLLGSTRVLLTGSHPEYWTAQMLDALEAWLDAGGRLMYLGGNGFYWVTSLFEDRPHVIEVRRGHAGTGVWRSEPGEVHHASTGEPGGLWRLRGRSPQRLAGVGFTAQGFDRSRPYRRTPDASDPRAAWIFEGVATNDFGAHGSVLNGAAGFEIDRADHLLGTPPHALIVATADGFSDVYQSASEDILTADSRQGGTVSPFVRADIVFYEGPNGGAVFSAGSIAWCGALLDDGGNNDVARITENVLRRFRQVHLIEHAPAPGQRDPNVSRHRSTGAGDSN